MREAPIVIGVAGKARSGKGTVSESIRSLTPAGVLLVTGFAMPIKWSVMIMAGSSSDDDKESPLPGHTFSSRQAYQVLGDAMRSLEPDFFIRRAERVLREEQELSDINAGVIFSDIRTEAECEWVRSKGGLVIHVSRMGSPSVGNPGHGTEAALPILSGDFYIHNDGTIDDLRSTARRLGSSWLRSKGVETDRKSVV